MVSVVHFFQTTSPRNTVLITGSHGSKLVSGWSVIASLSLKAREGMRTILFITIMGMRMYDDSALHTLGYSILQNLSAVGCGTFPSLCMSTIFMAQVGTTISPKCAPLFVLSSSDCEYRLVFPGIKSPKLQCNCTANLRTVQCHIFKKLYLYSVLLNTRYLRSLDWRLVFLSNFTSTGTELQFQ
jgi:hypothetical protein